MNYQNAVLIYNPAAGKMLRDPQRLVPVLQVLRAQGHSVRELPTTGPNQAAGLARQAIESGADLILTAGGDGTIHDVLEGMAGSRVPLAALPGGTANVLCMELGGSPSMRETARALSTYVPLRIPIGRFTYSDSRQRHFLLMAGVGLDARIIHQLDRSWKRRLGKAAYWLGGFSAVLGRLPLIRATLNGEQHIASFALASRVRNYGGNLVIAPTIHLREPSFEIVLFEGRYGIQYVPYLAGILARRLTGMPGVTIRRATRAEFHPFDSDPVPAQLDGEAAGSVPARIDIVPDALTLLVPPAYLERGMGKSS